MTQTLPRTKPSLRERLLRHVLVPLGISWVVGTGLAVTIAQHFAQRAFDRSLLDDAYLLATSVRSESGGLNLDLTAQELKTVLFDQVGKTYFSVRADDGSLVAGRQDLNMAQPQEGGVYRFDDAVVNGRPLRAVVLHRHGNPGFTVVVAQTTNVRSGLLQQLLVYSIAPQLLLLVLLALWLHRSVSRDVEPLSRLEQAVENRDADDLQPVQVNATTHDVAALSDAINALLRRLDRSLRAQREFAGNVAHELRTPLAGIRVLASYGLSRAEPQVWREQLEAIAQSETRASRLVDKLLALAVAAEAEAGLRLVPLALDETVRGAVLRHLARADAAGVDLGARGIDRPVRVIGDATLVEGILDNLLDNALRYGVAPNAKAPAITVSVDVEKSGEVTLGILDNGPGHPEASQEQLVARGVQGETGQLLGQGAGLGLALVAQYARLMKARLELGPGDDGHRCLCRVVFPPGQPAAGGGERA